MTSALAERRDREFEALYRRYAADVHRYALAVLHNAVDAEDVTQQTFMNAYRALVRGEQPHTPLHWLVAIAHNVCRERLRQSTRRPAEVELDESIVRAAAPDDGRWSAEEIRDALSDLGANQRAAIVLRELEGRSYGEIAQILGLSRTATEALAFRARRALREQLEGGLSCDEARVAVRRRLGGHMPRAEQGALRAHLRACPGCAGAARSQRGRSRRGLGSLAALPLPLTLKSLFGGGPVSAGAASAGNGIAVKAAAVAAAGVMATGVGYEGVRHIDRSGGQPGSVTVVPKLPRPHSPRVEPIRAVPVRTRPRLVIASRTARAGARRPARSAPRAHRRKVDPVPSGVPASTRGRQPHDEQAASAPEPKTLRRDPKPSKARGKTKHRAASHGRGRSAGAPAHSGRDSGPPDSKSKDTQRKAKGAQGRATGEPSQPALADPSAKSKNHE